MTTKRATKWQVDRKHGIKGQCIGRSQISLCCSRRLQSKTYELFHSGTFHLVFLDKLWTGRGGRNYCIYTQGMIPIQRLKLMMQETGRTARRADGIWCTRRASGCKHGQFSVGTEGLQSRRAGGRVEGESVAAVFWSQGNGQEGQLRVRSGKQMFLEKFTLEFRASQKDFQ